MHQDMSWVIGKYVQNVLAEGHRWTFRMTDGASLSVETHWQIVAEGHLRLASGDHGQQYGLDAPIDAARSAVDLLANRKIVAAVADPATADLRIDFDDAVSLRTFNDSSGFEAWQFTLPNGKLIVAQGGGNIVAYMAETQDEYTHRPDAQGHLKVMAVLREWDPIGVISEDNQDEYDSYAQSIVEMLDAGATAKDLMTFMTSIVVDHMGIGVDRKKTRACAEELVKFWRELKSR